MNLPSLKKVSVWQGCACQCLPWAAATYPLSHSLCVNCLLFLQEHGLNDFHAQPASSGHGWNKEEGDHFIDGASSLVEKATWASSQGPGGGELHSSAPAYWEHAMVRQQAPLNLGDFPSLAAAALARPHPAPQHTKLGGDSGNWDEDERSTARVPTGAAAAR